MPTRQLLQKKKEWACEGDCQQFVQAFEHKKKSLAYGHHEPDITPRIPQAQLRQEVL